MTIQQQFSDNLLPHLSTRVSQITVAYSGGLDSHVMLHLLAHTEGLEDVPVLVVHVNHGLSDNAQHWQSHSKAQAEALGFRFVAQTVEVVEDEGGIEAAARGARYLALKQLTPDSGIILLAQHLDDQLETVLLQLKRGAGPKGLAAMGHCVESARGVRLLRPLLNVSRAEIESYAQAFRLDWQEDESNLNTRFDRNFLRHQVVPLLTQRWPELPAAVKRSAQLCARQNALLEEVCADKLTGMLSEHDGLLTDKLCSLSADWQAELVRYWLSSQGAPLPSMAITEQILNAATSKADANPQVNWQGLSVKRFKGQLQLVAQTEPPQEQSLLLEKEQDVVFEHLGMQLSMAEAGQADISVEFPCQLEVRYRGFGTRFKPLNSPHSKPLKQWFKEWQIPPWKRGVMPQIWINGRLVALVSEQVLLIGDDQNKQAAGLRLKQVR